MSYETFAPEPINKKEIFSIEEKEFLNNKLQEMSEGALSEDDYIIFKDKNNIQYGLYEKEEVEKDKQSTSDLERSFQVKEKAQELEAYDYQEQLKIMETSRYLEALFYEKLGGADGWIPNSNVWKTSNYDDFKNGIDFIVELEEEHFGMAIDVTLSRRSNVIRNKLKKTKNLIDRGMLSEVKYYERPDDNESGVVPLIVIALDYDHAVQALKFWADGQDDLLNKHPTKVKAWLEARAQFEAFSLYAEKNGKSEIAGVYARARDVIDNIISNNTEMVEKYRENIEKDQAYQSIISFCDDL